MATNSKKTRSSWHIIYSGDYDKNDTDEEKIKRQIWIPCRICYKEFDELTLTARFCATCHRGFCHNHGSFRGRGKAFCLYCSHGE